MSDIPLSLALTEGADVIAIDAFSKSVPDNLDIIIGIAFIRVNMNLSNVLQSIERGFLLFARPMKHVSLEPPLHDVNHQKKNVFPIATCLFNCFSGKRTFTSSNALKS